jgi:hypothetical protein
MSNEPGIVSAFASGYQFSKTDLRVEGNAKVEQLEEGISYGCEFIPPGFGVLTNAAADATITRLQLREKIQETKCHYYPQYTE